MNRAQDELRVGEPRRWGSKRIAVSMGLLLVGIVWMHAGCGREDQPFKCGVALETDSDVIRYCGGEREICVCATNYCAEEEAECPSGYLYLSDPFGPLKCEDDDKCIKDRPCVKVEDRAGKVIDTGSRAACFANGGESNSSSSSSGSGGGAGGMGMDGGVNGGMGGGT